MSAVAYVPRDDEPPPRAKRSPLAFLTGGGLPPELEFHKGARELLLRTPWPARTLIADTCRKIPEFFGRGARFALEDVVDVGEVTVEHLLYLVIGAELSASDASDAYDRFLEEWWLDNVERGQGSVHIGLELL
jgi:hypothetical protein